MGSSRGGQAGAGPELTHAMHEDEQSKNATLRQVHRYMAEPKLMLVIRSSIAPLIQALLEGAALQTTLWKLVR